MSSNVANGPVHVAVRNGLCVFGRLRRQPIDGKNACQAADFISIEKLIFK